MLTERPWKIEAVLRYLLGLFASIFCGALLVAWLNSAHSPIHLDARYVTLVIGTLSFHGMALVLTGLFLREHEIDWGSGFGFSSPRLGRSILLAVMVGVAIFPICKSLQYVSIKMMARFDVEPIVQEAVKTLQSSTALVPKMLIGIAVIVLVPVAEELVFRGILYPAVKSQGFPRLAFWGTSLLFAAIHSNAAIFLPLLFLAVMLTLLYETTNNLLAPILTHSLFNLANYLEELIRSAAR